jgi:multisubunit Na+/H+ antiporter MnhG subunit
LGCIEGIKIMVRSVQLIWFLFTVAPVIALSIRTASARNKERKCERAWSLMAKYIG